MSKLMVWTNVLEPQVCTGPVLTAEMRSKAMLQAAGILDRLQTEVWKECGRQVGWTYSYMGDAIRYLRAEEHMLMEGKFRGGSHVSK